MQENPQTENEYFELDEFNAEQVKKSCEIISPPPRLTPSQWAEEFAYLPPEENAEPGKFHLSRRPHQTAMLDDVVDPTVMEVFWQMASQIGGKTVCLILLCEYVIHQLKTSMVMVRPDIDASMNWKRDKFLPTVEVTPCMNGLLVDPRKKDARSTSQNQRYPGGSMKMLGANSPSGFRSSTARVVFQDEIDAFRENAEGDPCKLGDRAATTFSDAWLIKASTTTLEGMSRINTGYERGDKQKYFVPCCCCGHMQHLQTEQMKFSFRPEEHARLDDDKKSFQEIVNEHQWEIGEFAIRDTPNTIYVCEKCKHGWTDDQRMAAYFSGHPDNSPVIVNGQELRAEWQATAPFKGIRSRHINGMYAVSGLKKAYRNYLHQFAEMFLIAKKGGRSTLMTWTNVFKNEPFAEVSEKMDWQPLMDRAEDFGPGLEPQVCLYQGAIDVQENPPRVEIKWIGWGVLEECWVLEWEVISGDFDMPEMQDRVWAHLAAKRFKHPFLGDMKWHSIAIDCGFQTRVKAVFNFCKKHRFDRVFPVKGFSGEALAALVEPHKDKRNKITVLHLNVDQFKSEVFSRLRLTEPGPRYIHIPKAEVTYLGDDGQTHKLKTSFTKKYYEELCSERRFPKRNKDGTISYRWEKVSQSARNEPLDLMDYIFGIYEVQKLGAQIGVIWEKIKRLMREMEQEKLLQAPPISNYSALPKSSPETLPDPVEHEIEFESSKVPGMDRRPQVRRPGLRRRPQARRPQFGGRGGGMFNPYAL